PRPQENLAPGSSIDHPEARRATAHRQRGRDRRGRSRSARGHRRSSTARAAPGNPAKDPPPPRGTSRAPGAFGRTRCPAAGRERHRCYAATPSSAPLVTVAAHRGCRLARALPAPRVRIATVGTDLVTANAIRCRPLLVTASAREQITPRHTTVKVTALRIASHPSGRGWILRVLRVAAHATGHVTAIAVAGLVTARAARGRGLGLQRMTHHEIALVHDDCFYLFGFALLRAQRLRHVVASLAVRRRVARLAKLLIGDRAAAVLLHEVFVVT